MCHRPVVTLALALDTAPAGAGHLRCVCTRMQVRVALSGPIAWILAMHVHAA